jgi:hypothetical protein
MPAWLPVPLHAWLSLSLGHILSKAAYNAWKLLPDDSARVTFLFVPRPDPTNRTEVIFHLAC